MMMMMVVVTAGVFCQFDSNNYGVFGIVFTYEIERLYKDNK